MQLDLRNARNPTEVGFLIFAQLLLIAVLQVFEHFSARLFALAAFFCAMLHRRVVRKFLAGFGTHLAAVGTGSTDHAAARPLASDDGRRGPASGCAVLAQLKRFEVLLLAFRNQLETVRATGIAGTSAVVARFSALHEMFVVIGSPSGRRGECERAERNCQSRDSEHGEASCL